MKMSVKDLMELLKNFDENDTVELSASAWFDYGNGASAELKVNDKIVMEAENEY